jgi:WD40 repeat protein
MAPELIKEQGGSISWRKADVWSLACTTLEMITGLPPWSQFNNHVTVLYHIACTEALPEYPPDSSMELITFLNMCLQRDAPRRPDITSLLMHPFVSGAGWSSGQVARPTTVSTTPAWAWENNTARETSRSTVVLMKDPLSSREDILLSIKEAKPFSTISDASIAQRKISESSISSLDEVHFSNDILVGITKVEISDTESLTSTSTTKRKLRNKSKDAKGVPGKHRKGEHKPRRSGSKPGIVGVQIQLDTVDDSNVILNNELLYSHLDESKDLIDWPKNDSDDEILEEIEESYEDSLELVEISGGHETIYNNSTTMGNSYDDLSSVDMTSMDLGVDKGGGSMWKIDHKQMPLSGSPTKQSVTSRTTHNNVKSQTSLRDRRQWAGGQVDVNKANNGGSATSFTDAVRNSPSPELGSFLHGFKAPQLSSRSYSQHPRGAGSSSASNPSTAAHEKAKRLRTGQILRTGTASVELDVYGDTFLRAGTSNTAYFGEDMDDIESSTRKHEEIDRWRVNLLSLEASSPQVLGEHQAAVSKLVIPQKCRHLLLSSSMDGTIKVWSSSSSQSRCTLDTTAFGLSADAVPESAVSSRKAHRPDASPTISIKVNHLWVDENCETVWGACADYNLRVWHGGEGRPMRFLRGHDDAITCMDGISSGGMQSVTLVASGSVDRTVRLFDLRARKAQVFVFKGHTDAVLAVKMAEDGKTVISGSKDKTIKLFDTRTGRIRCSLEKHFGAVSSLRLLSDQLASKSDAAFVSGGRDSMMNAWSMNGDNVGSTPAHRGALVRFSNVTEGVGGPLFLTSGTDAVVKVWDARRLKLMGEIRTGAVSEIICQQNAFIASSSSGHIKLWRSSETEGKLKDWTGVDFAQHSSPCTDLVCSSEYLASSSKSGQIFRWLAPS